MMKQEFETLTGQQLNDDDYGIVETITLLPGHPRRGRKEAGDTALQAARSDYSSRTCTSGPTYPN